MSSDLEIIKQQARDSLVSYSIYTDQFASNPFRSYTPKPYHIQICRTLESVFYWKEKYVIISVPPQHWKSTIVSQNFPSWALWKDPTLQFALASYWSNLSEWFSRKCRDLMKTPQYKSLFWNILKDDWQAVQERFTEKGWRFTSAGIWWPLTWKPVDIFIIDDYLKDNEEAQSKVIRDKIWERYFGTALSRMHKDSKMIIIATRRHEDDLIWKILENNWLQFKVINIPVYDNNNEPIRPERFPKDFLEMKRTANERLFQAMYMWDPINEWWWAFKNDFMYYERWELQGKDLEIVTYIDPAISQKQTADYTAIVTAWRDKKSNYIYVLDIVHEKILPDEIIDKVFEVVKTFKPDKVWIETNQYQKMLHDEIQKQMRIRNVFFYLDWQPSRGEKEARILSTLQPRYSNHSILHQKYWYNVNELETELLKFPNWKHDDIIDSLAWAIRMLEMSKPVFQQTIRPDNSKYV